MCRAVCESHIRVLATCFVRALLFVGPSLEQRAQGKPGADRTHGPRAMGRKLGGRTTGVTGYNPAFPARWVTAYTCSPRRDWALLSPSPQRASRNVKRHLPLGRQACTISPSALRALVSHTLGVHRISTHVRDDREAPLDRVRRGIDTLSCASDKAKYFRARGLTGFC